MPPSTVPGEQASPTQPFPTKPPAFDRQGVTVDDLIDFTPELRAEALEIIKKYVTGPLFTPPSVVGAGPERQEGHDPAAGVGRRRELDRRGVRSRDRHALRAVDDRTRSSPTCVPGDPKTHQPGVTGRRRASCCPGPRGLPLIKPPYGRITAIDLNTRRARLDGRQRRRSARSSALKPLNLPPLGHASRGALVVTKTLLFAPDGDQVNTRTPAGGGGRMFRALDKATGATIVGDRARRGRDRRADDLPAPAASSTSWWPSADASIRQSSSPSVCRRTTRDGRTWRLRHTLGSPSRSSSGRPRDPVRIVGVERPLAKRLRVATCPPPGRPTGCSAARSCPRDRRTRNTGCRG